MKKVLAVLLSAILLLGTFAMPGMAAFIDVEDSTKHHEAIEILVALGLLKGYEDNSFRPDNTITRAEFSTVIARMMGLESVATGASAANIFTDMTVGGGEHWASGYIKVAYDIGVILGMGDGTFAPDNPVTYEQAVKMLVCALGYEAAAADLGGWPTGYLVQAENLEMLQGLDVAKTNVSASRAMVAQLLYNSLEAKIAEKQPGGSVVATEKTILESKLGCARFNNYMVSQVDETESITDSGIRLQSGYMAFGQSKEAFAYGDVLTKSEAKALLGNYVKGYYVIGDDETANNILYIETSSTKSEEVIILSESIESFRNFKLEYYADPDDDNTEELEISSSAQLMYNGSLYDYKQGSASERNLTKWLDPASDDFIDGQVRLVENNGDKKIDAIFIEDYEIFVAKGAVLTSDSISSNNYVIYDNYVSGKNIRIDPYAPSVTAEFINATTGKEMRIEDIRSMNVVSVVANMSNTKFKVYVSTKTIKGKIGEMTAAGEYIIDGKAYTTTQGYRDLVDAEVIIPKHSAEGTFYLDHNDRICAAKITQEDAGAYAYVTNAGVDNDRAILKLMNLSGSPSKPTKVKCATTVKVNGKSQDDPQDVLDALENAASGISGNNGDEVTGDTYAQLIRYVKNSSGEITKITTVSMRDGSLVIGKNEDADKLVTGLEKTQFTYNTASGFNSKVFVSSKTLVLVVPDNRQDESDYKRSTAAGYFKSGTKYNIEAFDINASSVATVVLVYNVDQVSASTAVDYTTPVRIVTKISTGLSRVKEDDLVYHIDVYENGELKSYETESTGAPYNTLKIGDVVRFACNTDGQINKIGRNAENSHELDVNNLIAQFKYDMYNGTTNPIMYNSGEYYFKSIYGTISTLSDESIFITPALVDTTGEEPMLDVENAIGFRLTSGVKLYHLRLTDTKTEVNTLSNLNTAIEFGDLKNANATKVFAQAYAGTLRMIVVVVDERTAD